MVETVLPTRCLLVSRGASGTQQRNRRARERARESESDSKREKEGEERRRVEEMSQLEAFMLLLVPDQSN